MEEESEKEASHESLLKLIRAGDESPVEIQVDVVGVPGLQEGGLSGGACSKQKRLPVYKGV